MHINSLACENFRSLETQNVIFDSGANIFIGENAAGKTSVLEAIYLFAQGRSHRTAKEADFIKFSEDTADLSLSFFAQEREQNSSLRYVAQGTRAKPVRKICTRNNVPIKRMSEFIGYFRAVLFFPEHLGIIKDGPSERRNFLDCAICQIDPIYVSNLKRYNELLAKRNKLLCQNNEPADFETIYIYSLQMAKLGYEIACKRELYVRELDDCVKRIFSDMTAGKELPSLIYRGISEEGRLLHDLSENLAKELRIGTTLYGIHKDEVEISLSGKAARAFASQGQQRSLALSMKLAEALYCEKMCGERPVLLLDDVLSELDGIRQEYVLRGVLHSQTLITMCTTQTQTQTEEKAISEKKNFTDDVNLLLAKNKLYEKAKIFRIKNGLVI